MFAPYPRPDENFIDDESEEKMEFLIRVIRSIRNIRQTYNVPASADAEVMITCQDEDEMQTLATGSEYIERWPGSILSIFRWTADRPRWQPVKQFLL
jgi:valyl-tRNA synthetase